MDLKFDIFEKLVKTNENVELNEDKSRHFDNFTKFTILRLVSKFKKNPHNASFFGKSTLWNS